MKVNKRVAAAIVATSITTMGGVGLLTETASAHALPAQRVPTLNSATIGTPTVLESNEQPQARLAVFRKLDRRATRLVTEGDATFRAVRNYVSRTTICTTRLATLGSGGRATGHMTTDGDLPQDTQFDVAS